MHVNWYAFSDGVKLVIIRELCREMPSYDAVTFLQLEDGEIRQFIDIIEREVACQGGEEARIERANARQTELLMCGHGTQAREEWAAFMEEVIYGNQSCEPSLFMISKEEIENAICFLRDFRYREEFPDYDPATTPAHVLEDINAIPTYLTLESVINRLGAYEGVAVTYMSLEFESGLLGMFYEAERFAEEYNNSAHAASNVHALENQKSQSALQYEQPAALGIPQPRKPKNLKKFQTQEFQVPETNDDNDGDFDPTPKKRKSTTKRPAKKYKTPVEPPAKKLTQKRITKPKQPKGVLPPSRLRQVTNARDSAPPAPSMTSALARPAVSNNSTRDASLVKDPASDTTPLEQRLNRDETTVQGQFVPQPPQPRSPGEAQSGYHKGSTGEETSTGRQNSDKPSPVDESATLIKSAISTPAPDKAGLFSDVYNYEASQAPAPSHDSAAPSSTSTKPTKEQEGRYDSLQRTQSSTTNMKNGHGNLKYATNCATSGSASSLPVTETAGTPRSKSDKKAESQSKTMAAGQFDILGDKKAVEAKAADQLGMLVSKKGEKNSKSKSKIMTNAKAITTVGLNLSDYNEEGEGSGIDANAEPRLLTESPVQKKRNIKKDNPAAAPNKKPSIEVPNAHPAPSTKKQRGGRK